jgi:hypothetical protein
VHQRGGGQRHRTRSRGMRETRDGMSCQVTASSRWSILSGRPRAPLDWRAWAGCKARRVCNRLARREETERARSPGPGSRVAGSASLWRKPPCLHIPTPPHSTGCRMHTSLAVGRRHGSYWRRAPSKARNTGGARGKTSAHGTPGAGSNSTFPKSGSPVISGQELGVGVPRTEMTRANCSMSVVPGNTGAASSSSPNTQPGVRACMVLVMEAVDGRPRVSNRHPPLIHTDHTSSP